MLKTNTTSLVERNLVLPLPSEQARPRKRKNQETVGCEACSAAAKTRRKAKTVLLVYPATVQCSRIASNSNSNHNNYNNNNNSSNRLLSHLRVSSILTSLLNFLSHLSKAALNRLQLGRIRTLQNLHRKRTLPTTTHDSTSASTETSDPTASTIYLPSKRLDGHPSNTKKTHLIFHPHKPSTTSNHRFITSQTSLAPNSTLPPTTGQNSSLILVNPFVIAHRLSLRLISHSDRLRNHRWAHLPH